MAKNSLYIQTNKRVFQLFNENNLEVGLDGLDNNGEFITEIEHYDFFLLTDAYEDSFLKKLEESKYKGKIYTTKTIFDSISYKYEVKHLTFHLFESNEWVDSGYPFRFRFLQKLTDELITNIEFDVKTKKGIIRRVLWQNTSARPELTLSFFQFVKSYFGIILVVFAGICAALFFYISSYNSFSRTVTDVDLSLFEKAKEEQKLRNIAQEEVDYAKDLVRKFLQCDDVGELYKMTRPFSEKSTVLNDYYNEENPLKPFEKIEILLLTPKVLDEKSFYVVKVIAGSRKYSVILERFDSTSMLVDWESFVNYRKYTIEELIQLRPADPFELRCYLRKDSFYNYEFSSEREFQSYVIYEEKYGRTMHAYAPRGSKTHKELELLINPKVTRNYIAAPILKCLFPEGSKMKDGVLIEGVVSRSWLKSR